MKPIPDCADPAAPPRVPLVDAVPAAVPLLDAVPVARPLVSRLPMRSALGVLTYNEAEVAMALLAAGGALVPLKVIEMTAGRPLGPALAALRARVAEWSRTIEILRRHGGYVLIGRGHELEALFDAATDRLARKIADDRLLEWEDRTAGEILGARA